ncbi:xylulokinase [Agromyces archimandritae]|uniref:ATPase n=1 Tax=Agromyces archimandritae TaxID=2781962 RepID=A0A975FLP7_9MICO|nr:FGGY-family carbohydrate kinase [Agromyces archimandritae]QTX03763.1 ATPase [Agromyces archimandritae]
MQPDRSDTAADILAGRTALGIELGSTRIKACLVGADPGEVLAVGGCEWENEYADRRWTYSLDAVHAGLRAAYADLVAEVRRRYDVTPETFGAIGVSAMMHGYLAFDAADRLLVPFRTWRNTSTGPAAAELSELFGVNIPLRWSVAHLHQAVLDGEAHVPDVASITTLAGYVHRRLTGERVLGVGDASGMFPIDAAGTDYDAELLARYDRRTAGTALTAPLRRLLPEVRVAGQAAGRLTADGAALLDPSGALAPGIPCCPPEGDAGTGMVATNAVAPRTGNVSAGTSIFAMVVLERPLAHPHPELDLVTTPAGDPVAMVHCNNGASELAAWAGLFGRFAEAAGVPLEPDAVYETLFREALTGDADGGGLLAYNTLAGEPIAGLDEGRPMVVRTPDSRLTLGNFMRAQLYGMYGALALGMRVLAEEGVGIDRMFGHGGVFRTAGVAQRFLAGALAAPVAVGETASEGGAWGIAVLAAYLRDAGGADARGAAGVAPAAGGADVRGAAAGGAPAVGGAEALSAYLAEHVFAGAAVDTVDPDPADVAGFAAYLERFRAGLAAEEAAARAL